ncbi:MAG: VTT domain-containing protein [Pseudonocardiales bacterium]
MGEPRQPADIEPVGGSLMRCLLFVGGVLGLFLVVFVVAELLGVPLLSDPAGWRSHGGVVAAAAGVGLLVADVVLPVPSSVVMVAHGALFGVVIGTVLSLLGAVGAAAAGYGVGRYGGTPLLRAMCSEADRARADLLVRRWGLLAVAATRAVPLLAETIAVTAGASSLGLVRTMAAAVVGSLPGAVLYAMAGALGVGTPSALVVFGCVMLLAVGLWLIGRFGIGLRLG